MYKCERNNSQLDRRLEWSYQDQDSNSHLGRLCNLSVRKKDCKSRVGIKFKSIDLLLARSNQVQPCSKLEHKHHLYNSIRLCNYQLVKLRADF